MSTLEEHIRNVNQKLTELLKNYASLKKENQLLKEDIEASREKEKNFLETIDSLQQKVSILKASAGEMNETEHKEFEKRINIYLKEIDKCISLLSE